jgi:tetratricopeptide (TPR) repeat protein
MTPPPWYKRQQIVRQVFISLTLVIATVVVYLPVRHYEFVGFDDDKFVTENPNIRDGLTRRSVRWTLTAGLTHDERNADYWRPLSFLSHALDIELFGLRPAGHHLMNVGLHAATAVALFLVLQSMTNAFWRCAFVAALFALHPLRVESVAWVTERKDVLSGLFFMLTLGAYVGYVRHPFSWARYLAVGLLFALGLMSKSMVVTLPFVLLLLDYWPLGRTQWVTPVVAGQNITTTPGQLLKEKLPLFALAAASGLVTFRRAAPGPMGLLARMPLGTRIANALLAYVGYISKMVWPTRLAVFYPLHPGLPAAAVMGAGVGLVAATAGVIRAARCKPWLVTGWFWYLGMLVPVIGVFQGSGEAMADRFTYLPSIGLLIMLCWSVPSRAMERWNLKAITCVAAAAVLALCAALSRVQVAYWKDSETLFRHALDVTRDNWLAQYNLGCSLRQEGRMQEAIGHYEQALRIKPDYVEAHDDLGVVLVHLDRVQEAMAQWEQALRIKPDYVEAHYNLGMALGQMGKIEEAIAQYEQALRIKPDFAEAQYNLGVALARLGRLPEAVGHWEQALRIKPDFAEAHNNLGNALTPSSRIPEAIEHLERALRLKPDYAEAQYNLGVALARLGRLPEAVGHWEQALRLKPDYAEAENNLAWLLATLAPADGGDPVRAVTLAEWACELTNNRVAAYLDTLAVAYAAVGRFNDAIATAQKAIGLARSAGQTQVVSEIETRLELYRAGRAYRAPASVTSPHGP